MINKLDNRVWYGKYGGCFIADAFSDYCDEYYEKYQKAVNDPSFVQEFHSLKKTFAPTSLLLKKTETILTVHVSENFDSIIGTALLAKKLGYESAVCGVRYSDEAILIAKLCNFLKLRVLMILGDAVSHDEALCEALKLSNIEIDSNTCSILFDLPEMYAFQMWVASPHKYCIINCRSNAGAYPQTNISSDFSSDYGNDFKAAVPNSVKRIVIPCVTGSFALSIARAFEQTDTLIETVECDSAENMKEELDSYCGTFTKVMRNRKQDRILCPALSDLFDQGKVLRTIVPSSEVEIVDPSLSLQSNATLYVLKDGSEDSLCVLRNLRSGSTI